MRVSFIIPVRRESDVPRCLSSIRSSIYPKELVEILVVPGTNPSLQRNQAAARATGEILYFLDDDSELHPRALENLVATFRDFPDVAGVGGPSVGETHGTLFQKCVSMAMGSLFGFGPLRFRYYPSGCPRTASENELILSNFAVRKSAWVQQSGFDVRLYPNEENEFIRRMQGDGHCFFYSPWVVVFRPARETLAALFWQVCRYGSSRARHFTMRAHTINVLLTLPSIFFVYCFLLFGGNLAAEGPLPRAAWGPFALYSMFTVLASFYAALSVKNFKMRTFLFHLVIYPALHLGYGAGLLTGLLFPKAAGISFDIGEVQNHPVFDRSQPFVAES